MRVLFLTHRLPYAPNRGDRIRAFHIIRALAPRVELDLVSLVHDREEEAHADTLRRLGIRVKAFRASRRRAFAKSLASLTTKRPLTHVFLDAPGLSRALRAIAAERPPDVVFSYCSGMARFALEPSLRSFPLVLDFVDVDSEKWKLLAGTSSGLKSFVYAREARALAQFERCAALHARTSLVVNHREREALERVAPGAAVRVLPNGVDLDGFAPPGGPAAGHTIIFCGVMNYQPNIEGVVWFAEQVWPTIVERRPDVKLVIAGSEPVAAVRRLARLDRRIQITGRVADVQPFLWDAAVSIAPLRLARGVQNKVLEALAAGLPVVVTSPVFNGLPSEAQPGCAVADEPEDFARRVLGLLALDGSARRGIAQKATLERLSWECCLSPLLEILARAAIRRAGSTRSRESSWPLPHPQNQV